MNKDLTLEIKANTKRAVKQIEELKNEIKSFKKNVDSSTKTLKTNKQSIDTITSSLKSLALAFGAFEVAKSAVSAIANFESGLKKLEAISGASGQALKDMENKARELGETTQYSASQVVEAMNYQAMAGMKSNEILTATKDILDLATVGNMDLARASDIATDSMSGFGLKAKDLHRVTDVMAVTITNANTDVEQLGEAFKMVAPLAHSLNLTIEQTSAMLGVLANAGLKGGIAGTHLKIILQRLSSTTADVQKGFKALGLSAYDSNGKLKPMGETLKAIKEKLKSLNDQQKAEVLKNLFGREAISSAHILLDNLGEVDKLYKKISKSSGKAGDMAKKMQDSLSGAWKELKSALEGLALTIGDDLLPALTDVVKELVEITRSTTEFYKENKALIRTIVELVTALYGFAKIKAILTSVLGASALIEITSFAGGIATLKKAFDALKIAIMGLSRANIILAGLTAVMAGVDYALNEWQASIDELNKKVEVNNNLNKKTKDIITDLLEHYDRQTRKMTLTIEQQKKYKKEVENLIKTKEAYLKTLDPKEQENLYKATEDSIRVLGLYKKKIDEAIISQKNRIKITDEQIKKIKVLTKEEKKAQKEFIENLDSRLEKEREKDRTLEESYNLELERLKKLKFSEEEYLKQKDKLDEYYQKKIEDRDKKIADKIYKEKKRELNKLKNLYKRRVDAHENSLKKLFEKEKSIKEKIEKLNEDLANKLKDIDLERLHSKESLEYKIHSLEMAGAKDIDKYRDKQKRADELLSKAKIALKKNELKEYKRYKGEYESLVTSIANTEIKQGKRILVSKKQSARYGINALKQLSGLEDTYYDKRKAEAIKLHNQKVAQLKIELQATKAQIQLEIQRLQLEKQLLEATTGKKIDIDISGALEAVKAIDSNIKELDKQIKKPLKLKADGTQAVNEVKKVRKYLGDMTYKGYTYKIYSDTTPATFGIQKLISIQKGKEITIKVNPEYIEAQKKIDNAIKNFERKPVKTKITADTKQANRDTNILKKKIAKPTTTKVKADTRLANSVIKKLRDRAKSPIKMTVKVDATKAFSIISKLKKNTSSIHTIYVREVKRRATGGLIGPVRLATGGSADFERKRGRISGYDPTDSDDVPALLTRGEFVIKREAVKHYGDDLLYKLNNMQLPKFATGGLVEIGKPEKLISLLSSSSGGSSGEYGSNSTGSFDPSKIDELLREIALLEGSKLGNTFRKRLQEIKKALLDVKAQSGKIEEKTKENISLSAKIEKIKRDSYLNGKSLTDVGSLKALEDKLKANEGATTTLSKGIDKKTYDLETRLEKFKNELEEYKQQVEEFKDKIRSKFDDLELNPDDFLGRNFDESFDLEKLKNYYYKIQSFRKTDINKDALASKYVHFMRQKANELARYKTHNATYGFRNIIPDNLKYINSFIMERALGLPYGTLGNKRIKVAGIYEPNDRILADGQSIIQKMYKGQLEAFKRSLPRFKTGGAIDGISGGKLSGYGGGDRNLALLEDGEFILRKEAVSHFGADLLHSLNNLKVPLPKFQSGGSVGSLSTKSNPSMDINFNLPNGKSFAMNSEINVAKAFAQELKRMM